MEQLVRFLFGHERAVFRNGQFGFDVRPGALTLVLIFLVIGVFTYFIYIRKRGRLPKRIRFNIFRWKKQRRGFRHSIRMRRLILHN